MSSDSEYPDPGPPDPEKSGQSYTLILPIIQQQKLIHDATHSDGRNPPTNLLHTWKCKAFHNLAKHGHSHNFHAIVGIGKSPKSGQSQLEKLPKELLLMVLKLLKPHDLAALAICSRELLIIFLGHLRGYYRALWANQPMICTGTWLTSLPKAIIDLYPDYYEAQETGIEGNPTEQLVQPVVRGIRAREWNDHMWREHCYVMRYKGQHIKWYKVLKQQLTMDLRDRGCAHVSRKRIFALLRNYVWIALGMSENFVGRWVWRNLDAKLYVRLEARAEVGESMIPSKPGGSFSGLVVTVQGYPWCNLDHALLYKIMWAGKVDCTSPWAGHRFDIVTERDHHVRSGKGWVDYTHHLASECDFLRGSGQ